MQIAHVQRVRLSHAWRRNRCVERAGREHRRGRERDDMDAIGGNVIRGGDLASRERRIGDDAIRSACGLTIEGPAKGVVLVRMPLGMARVADVMDREHERVHAPERCLIRWRVEDVEASAARGQRQRRRHPSEIRRKRHRAAASDACGERDGWSPRRSRRSRSTDRSRASPSTTRRHTAGRRQPATQTLDRQRQCGTVVTA